MITTIYDDDVTSFITDRTGKNDEQRMSVSMGKTKLVYFFVITTVIWVMLTKLQSTYFEPVMI